VIVGIGGIEEIGGEIGTEAIGGEFLAVVRRRGDGGMIGEGGTGTEGGIGGTGGISDCVVAVVIIGMGLRVGGMAGMVQVGGTSAGGKVGEGKGPVVVCGSGVVGEEKGLVGWVGRGGESRL